MMDRSRADQVVSGLGYEVAAVDGRPPTDLGDFVATPVVVVDIRAGDGVRTIAGESRVDGDVVVLYEKDGSGTGKDVRTWIVRAGAEGFEAVERSTF